MKRKLFWLRMAFKESPTCFFKGSRTRQSRWRVRRGKGLKGGGKQRKGRDNIEGSELFFWMENILWLKENQIPLLLRLVVY